MKGIKKLLTTRVSSLYQILDNDTLNELSLQQDNKHKLSYELHYGWCWRIIHV